MVAELSDVRLSTPLRRVRRYANHVEVDTPARAGERFDQVVFASHSDQTLALLADATRQESDLLRQVRYQSNRVLLHTDVRLMPRRRRAWSAWNYLAAYSNERDRLPRAPQYPNGPERAARRHSNDSANAPVCVTYWINKLQPLPFRTPVLVTLNPAFEPAADTLIAEFEYSHPIVKNAAVTAQQHFAHLQGQRRSWYAGAWLGHGFHEDGLASAHLVAQGIAARSMTAAAELAAA
jgi:predicted NAD/FAD-binding protein